MLTDSELLLAVEGMGSFPKSQRKSVGLIPLGIIFFAVKTSWNALVHTALSEILESDRDLQYEYKYCGKSKCLSCSFSVHEHTDHKN